MRTYAPQALRGLAAVCEDLVELVAGRPAEPDAVWATIQAALRLQGTKGLVGTAIAAIDMAVWDAHAQRQGVSLARALGATVDRVPAYRALRATEPDAAAREAATAIDTGFTAVKVKVIPDAVEAEARLIDAVRSAAGPDATVMVDYNQSLTVAAALERAPMLDARELGWIEEPTRAGRLEAHAAIRRALRTPVQLGENLGAPDELRSALRLEASDLLTIDVANIGGVTAWVEAAGLAAAAGIPVSSHAFVEFSAHLLAASATCHWLEFADHLAPIRREPVELRDGHVVVRDTPGTGLDWDEDAIARLR